MRHGGGGYAKYGCRCSVCTEAQRARVREYRKRRTDAVTSDVVATSSGHNQIAPASAGTDRGHGKQEGTS